MMIIKKLGLWLAVDLGIPGYVLMTIAVIVSLGVFACFYGMWKMDLSK